MLCPTERITDRRALIRTRGGNKRVRNFVKQRRRNPANLLHHFGRVAGKVAAQCLENAARILQAKVTIGKTEVGLAFVEPAFLVVSALLLVPAREKAGRALIGVAKIFA